WISRPPYPLKYNKTWKTKPTQHHTIGTKNQPIACQSFLEMSARSRELATSISQKPVISQSHSRH
ncbi:hypothetical protein ACPUET_13790, partial [Paraburkholderia graminis]|uniref:hypothetical protein n=1 Tax=Paraburkholderia graminis TaxID=60548 RepID=UPI003CBC41A0